MTEFTHVSRFFLRNTARKAIFATETLCQSYLDLTLINLDPKLKLAQHFKPAPRPDEGPNEAIFYLKSFNAGWCGQKKKSPPHPISNTKPQINPRYISALDPCLYSRLKSKLFKLNSMIVIKNSHTLFGLISINDTWYRVKGRFVKSLSWASFTPVPIVYRIMVLFCSSGEINWFL